MPNLIIYIPFPQGGAGTDGDIQTNARLLGAVTPANLTINGQPMNEIVVVYRGQEQDQVQQDDYVLVHGHGGSGRNYAVADNHGATISRGDLRAALVRLGAERAAAIYFFICFSSETNHIANVWRQEHPNQDVYGSDVEAEGGLFRSTRSGAIRNSVFTSGQLRQL